MILIGLVIVALYAVPSIIDGFRTLRRARELARQIEGEQKAREALRQSWEARK